MARDYSKIKAMAQEILKCIGDEEEGKNPSIPKSPADPDPATTESGVGNDGEGGQDSLLNFIGDELKDGKEESEPAPDEDNKKKKRESSLAMMGSVLASKVRG